MAVKKPALGRGLDALISKPEPPRTAKNEIVKEIEIHLIEINPFQPRTTFDEESLNELASSIEKNGIIQPITVRKLSDKKYQLIAGERRLRAAKIAGYTKIISYIREVDDQSLLELALVENIQRKDLDPIEISISYKRLIEECNLTQEVMSERVGKKRSTITNYLRLLKLPPEIQLGLRNNLIQMGHAKVLVTVEDENEQLKLFYRIIEQELTVRKIEEIIREHKNIGKKTTSRNRLPKEYIQMRNRLSEFFKTSVQFKRDSKGKGRIVIPFKTDNELESIIGLFDKMNS